MFFYGFIIIRLSVVVWGIKLFSPFLFPLLYLLIFPFSSSPLLSLSCSILSHISMIAGSQGDGLIDPHLHLYPHITILIDHCSFPYLANFMFAVVGAGAFKLCCCLFRDIHIALKISMIYNSTVESLVIFPFSSSHVLSLCGYILSHLSMIVGSNVGRLTYIYLHLYNHTTNPTNHCFFPYLANFMAKIGGFTVSNSASCFIVYILHSKLMWSTIPTWTHWTHKLHSTTTHKCFKFFVAAFYPH